MQELNHNHIKHLDCQAPEYQMCLLNGILVTQTRKADM